MTTNTKNTKGTKNTFLNASAAQRQWASRNAFFVFFVSFVLVDFSWRDEHAAKLAAPQDLDRHELPDAFLGEQPM